ncbi:MAG: MFS transporter [Rickettsiales bacterium]
MKFLYIFPLCLSTFANYFCFALYIFYLKDISQFCFGSSDGEAFKNGMIVLTAGFISRPIGGLISGLFSDVKSKKYTYMVMLCLLSLTCVYMSYLEENTSFISLIIVRLIQTMCLGSEFTNSILLAKENNKKKQSFSMSLITSSGTLGWIMASFFSTNYNYHLAWKPLYLACAIILAFCSLMIFFLDFKQHVKRNLYKVTGELLSYKKHILYTSIFAGVNGSLFYLIIVYTKIVITSNGHFDENQASFFILILLILYSVFLPICGYILDKFSAINSYLGALLFTLILLNPLITSITQANDIKIIFIEGAVLMILMSLLMVSSMRVVTSLFESCIKYSGVSFSYNLGNAIFGGLTPLISLFLFKETQFEILPYLLYQLLVIYAIVIIYKKMAALQKTKVLS